MTDSLSKISSTGHCIAVVPRLACSPPTRPRNWISAVDSSTINLARITMSLLRLVTYSLLESPTIAFLSPQSVCFRFTPPVLGPQVWMPRLSIQQVPDSCNLGYIDSSSTSYPSQYLIDCMFEWATLITGAPSVTKGAKSWSDSAGRDSSGSYWSTNWGQHITR